jgi:hypothetical protein
MRPRRQRESVSMGLYLLLLGVLGLIGLMLVLARWF